MPELTINKIMKRQFELLVTAITFYTRIRVPWKVEYSPEKLNNATRYFPLVGIITGGIIALVFYCLNIFVSVHLAIIISLIISVLLTGGFHEDGLADFIDGMGGGYSKEQIMTIMKDSRIGTFGALGLILNMILKWLLISELPEQQIPVILIAANSVSRLNPVILIYSSEYVSHGKSKDVGTKGSAGTLVIAIITALLPLALVKPVSILSVLLALPVVLIPFRRYLTKKIGGYTGDALGALQQISELAVYFALIIATEII